MQTHIVPSTALHPTVAVVDGDARVFAVLDQVLRGTRYDVLVLDSRTHAYRDVKRQRPSVVVYGGALDSMYYCQLLTMLKVDEETRDIPVITLALADDTEGKD